MCVARRAVWIGSSGAAMTFISQPYVEAAWPLDAPQQRAIHHPLLVLLLLFVLLTVGALADLAYLTVASWPNWADASDAPDTPSVPIVVAGVPFHIQPTAIRWAMQRQPGMQSRVDLVYLWPSLQPPAVATRPTVIAPANPDQLLFVTIQSGDDTLPMMERVQKVYPRYLAGKPTAGPPGLMLQSFRNDAPYKGEDLVFDTQAPTHFLARCTRQNEANSGTCLLERRISSADITFRFPRAWLDDWQSVASGIDKLTSLLHPGNQHAPAVLRRVLY